MFLFLFLFFFTNDYKFVLMLVEDIQTQILLTSPFCYSLFKLINTQKRKKEKKVDLTVSYLLSDFFVCLLMSDDL